MKQFIRIFALVCCVAALLSLAACGNDPATPTTVPTVPTTQPTTEPTTVPTTEPPPTHEEMAAVYTDAVAALGSEAVSMDITISRSLTVGGQSFSFAETQKLSQWNIGAEGYLASVTNTIVYGGLHEVTLSEIYSGGNVYQTLGKNLYTSAMTAEDFTARYSPISLLDPALYTLTLSEDNGNTVVNFTDATAGESWLLDEDMVLNSASGFAVVDAEGKLLSVNYTVDYSYGPASYVETYDVTYGKNIKEPTVPEDTSKYVTLDDIDSVWLLEHAYGCLNQARQVSSIYLSTIASQAGRVVLNDRVYVHSYTKDTCTDFKITTNSTIVSSDGTSESQLEEYFVDGKYSSVTDGGRPVYKSSIEEAELLDKMTYALGRNIIDEFHFSNAAIIDVGGLYLVEFTPSDEFGKYMDRQLCGQLYGPADMLDELASKYATNWMTYYISFDKYSMLPVAVGLEYEGVHTIYGRKYTLSQSVSQNFDLASMYAYQEIHGEPSPDVEPEQKATPLFYHVTGPNGQEMWLFGTIHIGDDRTGFLPQEIYDALLSSKALAVECDTEGFSDALEEDEELQKKISELYYYSKGTMFDHLDTEGLDGSAYYLMRATGNYNYNSDNLKAYLWSSDIENFYLRQGYHLTSDKGVESRLEKLAKENDIPLWEVESTLFQIEMMTGFSDELQEFLLYSSVAGDKMFAWEDSDELYELWCAGDEAALIEKMANEPWVITEEDLADTEGMDEEDLKKRQEILDNLETINAELAKIQEEYVTAMETSRNAGMLEVAKEYLESGDVVFYAVGLAHLLAEDGLVNTLRAAGYTVELVEYAK